ncbi:MAG: glycosyl hydrolase family 65 protein [Acidimicrobiia bacterium]
MSRWALVYDDYSESSEGLREALCALGNGLFVTRGAAAEADADGTHYPGTYAAGVYDRLTTSISGRDIENEDLVNLPNWLLLSIGIEDDPWFDIGSVEILGFKQELDMRRGVLTRIVDFRDDSGRETILTQRRLVSMDDPHLAALETTLRPIGWSGRIRLRSALDGRVKNSGVERYRELASSHLMPVAAESIDGESMLLEVETRQSHIRIAEAARTRLFVDGDLLTPGRRVESNPGLVAEELVVDTLEGSEIRLEKVVALAHSRLQAMSEPALDVRGRLARSGDFDRILQRHVLAWDHLWQRCELRIEGSERAARILNLHIFHLLQTVSEHSRDLDVGVPARGLHGEAYRGHIFWDELFVFPFLNYHLPELTRALLLYRYRRLDTARWAALDAGLQGAMYPWQSGSTGREESQSVHLNPRSGRWIPDHSRLQRHVGIAVAYNVWLYYQATADIDFLTRYGAEMMVEISRFWSGSAVYDHIRDRYRILGVMGPDEYHDGYPDRADPGLDDNAYTNVMAVWVLRRTMEALMLLRDDDRRQLVERLGLKREELERWEDVTRKMFVPFHDEGIISQFEGYEDLAEFDWTGYRERYGDIQRLDRLLEAEGDSPNAYKASKQADVLMLFYLLSPEDLAAILKGLGYSWGEDSVARNVDYYRLRTSHGSTLSWVVHAWVLARTDRAESWSLFMAAMESDIADIQGGTTAEGIHLGAMAGTVDLVQRCYSGLEPAGDVIRLAPRLPDELELLEYRLLYRGRWMDVRIADGSMRVTVRPDGDLPVSLQIGERVVDVAPGESVEL